MILWLHDLGYTYFEIPKLTYPEIVSLSNAYNRRRRKQEARMKKLNRIKRRK